MSAGGFPRGPRELRGGRPVGSGLSGLPGAPLPGPAPFWRAHECGDPLSTSSRERQARAGPGKVQAASRTQTPELQAGAVRARTQLHSPHLGPSFHSKRIAP